MRQVISLLAGQRPVIAHCFAGKDRTGFTVATVLEAVGVDRDAILSDFLRSNEAVPRLRDSILESIRNRAEDGTDEIVTFAEARLTDEVLGVREEYLDAARRSIDGELRLAARLSRGHGCAGRRGRAPARGAARLTLRSDHGGNDAGRTLITVR